MKLVRKLLTAAVILGVIGVAVYYSLAPRPILVETVEVERGPLQVSIVEEGKTRVADRYVVSAPVSGALRRVRWEVGDVVTKGQALARIDPPSAAALDPRARAAAQSRISVAEAALEKAKNDVLTAQSDVRYWETEKPRIEEAVQEGLMARERLDQAVADERRAKAVFSAAEQQVEVARSELEAARIQLDLAAAALGDGAAPVTVRAPVAGRILEVMQESEAVVQASQPLLSIADPNGLEVAVEALSSDAVQLSEGMRVLLERWGGPQPLEGVVRLVEPTGFTKVSALGVEEQRVLVIVDIVSPKDEWEMLGDQYRVEARFITWEGVDVLQVPSSALFRRGDGWAVFRVQGEIAQIAPVEVGRSSGLRTEIRTGLSIGDRVVTHPSDALSDGALVELSSDSAGPAS